MLTTVFTLLVSPVLAGSLNSGCIDKLNSLISNHIILANSSDLNALSPEDDGDEYYDPRSEATLRSVPLLRIVDGKITNDLYIFDPRRSGRGITVQTDGHIKAVEISAYPALNKGLGLAISDKNLYLFDPADGNLIKSLSLQEIDETKFPIVFHEEKNPRDIFVIEKNHVQVISRETGIIYHDMSLTKVLQPKGEGLIKKTIETSTGGIIDLILNERLLILKNSHNGEILKTVFLKDIVFPFDLDLLVEQGLVLNLFLAPDGSASISDRKTMNPILRFQATPFKTL